VSPGNRNLFVRNLSLLSVFCCLASASFGNDQVSATGEEDPLVQMRVIRFQVRVLSETAKELEQKARTEDALLVLAQACKTGWKGLQAIPADRFGEEEIAVCARSLAGEIGAGASWLLKLVTDSDAVSGNSDAPSTISRNEIYRGQITTLDHIRGPVTMRLEWRIGRLDEESSLKELAPWFAECAELLDGLTSGEEAIVAYRERLSLSLDKTLKDRREELSELGGGEDISNIVADFCRGRPGEEGKKELIELLRSRFEACRPNLLEDGRSGGKEQAAPATPEQIVFFFNLARVIYRALEPGEGGSIPGWRETFEKYFRELTVVVKPLARESIEANSSLENRPGVDLSEYSDRVPAEKLQIRMLIEEGGKAPALPSLRELGLDNYFLPAGAYSYLLDIKGAGGRFGTIFTAPVGANEFDVTIPAYLPADRIFIPASGYSQGGTVFGNRPLTRREFAQVIFDKKGVGARRPEVLDGQLKDFYTSVIGSDPVEGMKKPEHLEATQQEMERGGESVFLDIAQGRKCLMLFGFARVEAGGFSLAPALQIDLLSRYLQLTSASDGDALKGVILAAGPENFPAGEKRRFLLFPASRVVFSK